MPQSLSSLLIHLIFSTKDRYPFLNQEDLLSRTHAYLGGILREAGSPSITIGGTVDHVHAVCPAPSKCPKWLKRLRAIHPAG